MKFIVPLIVAAFVSATALSTSGSSSDGEESPLMDHPTLARQLQANTTRIVSGFVTMTLGTDMACTPVTGVVRVQLGVCSQLAEIYDDDYYRTHPMLVMYHVEQTGINAQLIRARYYDATCDTPFETRTVASFAKGCGTVQLNLMDYRDTSGYSLNYGLNDDFDSHMGPPYDVSWPGLHLPSPFPKYATVTLDADFNALPAASSASMTWHALEIYGHPDACAHPSTNAPT